MADIINARKEEFVERTYNDCYVCVQGRLPVKWTAYEGLLYGKYTTQSDV